MGLPLRLILTMTALLALAVLASTACQPGEGGPDVSPETGGYRGQVLTRGLIKPSALLFDTSGKLFDFRTETKGSVTLLYFGYTHCPDICPSHMANIAAALGRLPRKDAQRIKTVFVTVDPERDTPQRLRQWLDLFDPSFIGLTGSPDAVDTAMRQALGDLYFPVTREDRGQDSYSVSHPAFVIAYTQDDVAHIVYPQEAQPEDYLHDIARMLRDGWTRPAPETPSDAPAAAPSTAASAPAPGAGAGPRRLAPQEARRLLGLEPSATDIEAVKAAIDNAYARHPEAQHFISQGLSVPLERIDLETRICSSRPQGKQDASLLACSTLGACARLTRIMYDYYVQSGYEEFFQAAAAVYSYVATSLPDEFQAFYFILRSDLRVSGLPAD